jgi:hypothetical protein
MIFSKKLLLLVALGLGLQSTTFAYNTIQLKDEVKIIENYINNHPIIPLGYFVITGEPLALWLFGKIESTYLTSDKTIITIANALNSNNINLLEKMRLSDERFYNKIDTISHIANILANISFITIIFSKWKQHNTTNTKKFLGIAVGLYLAKDTITSLKTILGNPKTGAI